MRTRLAPIGAAIGRMFPLWTNRSARTRKRLRRLFVILSTIYVVGSAPAWAGAADDKQPSIAPTGMGGLITIPDLSAGRSKTLFESYGTARYQIYTDLSGWGDAPESVMGYLYQMLSLLAFFLTKLGVGLAWWQVQLTGTSTGADSIGKAIQSAGTELNGWVLPSALAIGGCIAYLKARTGDNAFGQVVTCLAYGLAAIGIATSGVTIVNAADNARVALSNAINKAGGQAVSDSDVPFDMPGADLTSGDDVSNASRAQGDAVWRAFYVTPWCQMEFGSLQACKEYGYQWLNSPNMKARKDNVLSQIEKRDKSTAEYMKGHNPADRLGVGVIGLLIALLGCIVMGGLALLALMPWVLALILAFVSVFFLAMGCIPGRCRQICNDFLATELGLTVTSALTGAILTGMLLTVLAANQITATQGWLPGFLMIVAAMGGAWVGRKRLEQMLTGGGGSGGMGMLGAMIGGRMLARSMGRMAGSVMKSRPGRAVAGKLGAGASRAADAGRSASARFQSSSANLPGRAGAAGRRFYQAKTAPARKRAAAARDAAARRVQTAKGYPGKVGRQAAGHVKDAARRGGSTVLSKMPNHGPAVSDGTAGETGRYAAPGVGRAGARAEAGSGRYEAIRDGQGGRGTAPGATAKNAPPRTTRPNHARVSPTSPKPSGTAGRPLSGRAGAVQRNAARQAARKAARPHTGPRHSQQRRQEEAQTSGGTATATKAWPQPAGARRPQNSEGTAFDWSQLGNQNARTRAPRKGTPRKKG